MERIVLCDEDELAVVAPLCRRYGLGIECQAFYHWKHLESASDAIAEHERHLDGIPFRAMHGPFGDLHPASFDPKVRELALLRFEQACPIATRLGATDMVLHLGHTPGGSPPAGYRSRGIPFWRDFAARHAGLRLHLENLFEHDATLVADVLAAVDLPNVDACLDIGHAHCHGRVAITDWIERLGSRIGWVHLHDNRGETDEHLGLGRGTVPLAEVCAALEQHAPDATWALETRVDDKEPSLAWLRERGYLGDATGSATCSRHQR